uniref:Macro domain-containing protein n=1 Tax=Rhabditophanes sp. KR3021 TaxID=114890 RepID=A0AC35TUG6_9BILA
MVSAVVKIIQGDITKLKVDVIVNAAQKTLLGGGGVDGAIHKAAGRELVKECGTLNGCLTGEVKKTQAYKIVDVKAIFHTVAPIVRGQLQDKHKVKLVECYENSLKLADENRYETIAFPSLGTGYYGFPFEESVPLVLGIVKKYLDSHPQTWLKTIYICVFSDNDLKAYQKMYPAYFPKHVI